MPKSPSDVASLTHTDQHHPEIVEVLSPQGKLALIDEPSSIDINQLKLIRGKRLNSNFTQQ